jgi:hypothetical protein
MNPSRRGLVVDSLLQVLIVSGLIGPLFWLKYLDNWPSIESTFISDARMLGEHLPHPAWQPLWYAGTRTDYIYPPALRYGTVLISKIGHVIPARAYHLYIAIFYVFGIVAVYWLVRTGCGARAPALLASFATALLSPCFLLMRNLRADSGFRVPQRLHVLMTYGEGPHISALSVLPAALAACLVALRGRSNRALALASGLCAIVVANNFYGATALAILYPILVWSVWVTDANQKNATRAILLRAFAIPLLAWGMSAFWLTPSYFRITMLDLKWVSQPANTLGRVIYVGALLLFGLISWWFARRRPDYLWPTFVAGAVVTMSVYVLGSHFFGLAVSGDATRLAPELDLALILGATEVVRRLWQRSGLRPLLLVAIVVAFSPSVRYIRHAWSPFPKASPLETVYQYKTAAWVHRNLPGARILPAGTVRFWFDAWSDNQQLDGGSAQGLANQIIPVATWQVLHGDRTDLSLLWLQALGTDAIVVPGKQSLEPYRDYQHQEKFRGILQPVFDDGQGTLIYPIPRVHPGIVRTVSAKAIDALMPITGGDDLAGLTKYVTAIETPGQSGDLQWSGFDEARVHATTGVGESILVQETWDSAWHAFENGKAVPVRLEKIMGFMLLDVPPGRHDLQLRFETPLENRVGRFIFAATALILIALSLNFRCF